MTALKSTEAGSSVALAKMEASANVRLPKDPACPQQNVMPGLPVRRSLLPANEGRIQHPDHIILRRSPRISAKIPFTRYEIPNSACGLAGFL